MAKRKPRVVWVWIDERNKIWHYDGRPDCESKKPCAAWMARSDCGRYVPFVEVLPKKRKVKRGKK